MLMIPDKINDLNFDIKNIENIVFSNNTISWFVLDIGNKITLTKYPLCLKFENNEKKEELQTLIQDHFDKMKLLGQPAHHMQEEACKQLRNSIYDENKIDGEKKHAETYNHMSLLHFFGTWLGPTNDNHAEGHAIMNNLHYELFGFHQYHGRQYISIDDWKDPQYKCGDECQHETCLKHAKNKDVNDSLFYKVNSDVFSAYHNYLKYFIE